MAWRQNQVFEALTLYDFGALAMTLGSGDPPQQVNAVHVSSEYFKVFGVAPIVGRTFTPAEDLPGGAPVAVVGYGLWQSRFGADANVIGRPLLLNRVPYSIVGILPAGFHSDPDAEVWLPLQADPNSANQGHYLNVAGRLKPGVTIATAQAQMKVIGEQFRKAYPKWMDDKESVAVRSMRDATTGEVRTALLILLGAVALVLLYRVRQRRQSVALAGLRDGSARSRYAPRSARAAGASSGNCLQRASCWRGAAVCSDSDWAHGAFVDCFCLCREISLG